MNQLKSLFRKYYNGFIGLFTKNTNNFGNFVNLNSFNRNIEEFDGFEYIKPNKINNLKTNFYQEECMGFKDIIKSEKNNITNNTKKNSFHIFEIINEINKEGSVLISEYLFDSNKEPKKLISYDSLKSNENSILESEYPSSNPSNQISFEISEELQKNYNILPKF